MFPSGGISMTFVLSESHLNIHTWPENDICYVDFFTCGSRCDPHKGMVYIKTELAAEGGIQVINRNAYKRQSENFLIDSVSAGELLE